MKHPLPPTLLPQLAGGALLAIALAFVSIPSMAQDASHHRNRHGEQAVLHIRVHIVPFTMMPRHHHKDDDGDDALRINMPSKDPAMTVIETTRDWRPSETTVKLGPEGAVLKTITVVPE